MITYQYKTMGVGMLSFLGLLICTIFCVWVGGEEFGDMQDKISRLLTTDNSILNDDSYTSLSTFKLYYDPPNGHTSPNAMAVYVWSNVDNAKIYWELSGSSPTINSSYATSTSPYIEVDTPFKGSRNRTLIIIGVYTDADGRNFKSEEITLKYFVEASARPYSYGYLIPGIESSGYFLQFALEVRATARAQAAGSQEFADFFTSLGIGTYSTQIQALNLLAIDPDLQGFEGGFPYNTSAGEYFGLLIPYHNGLDFFGKVVKINLKSMVDAEACGQSYMIEYLDSYGRIRKNGTALTGDACVHMLDLSTLNDRARGFRRGFVGYPYGYLSAGRYNVLVRLDLNNFGLRTTRLLDLVNIDTTLGGYSGGFEDGSWACFCPFRSFVGAVGGMRSVMEVDGNNLRPYYSSIMFCANSSAWQEYNATTAPPASTYRIVDFSTIDLTLRGYADAIRVGRYAYLVPLNPADNTFSSQLLRINLGKESVINSVDAALAKAGNVRSIVNILDLAKVNTNLKGFSGAFTSGKYLILVPFRNAYEAANGQRGHGYLTRLNMNDFTASGVEYLDLTSTTRNQIPSFADTNLRGYSFGFATGQYGVLVPFYNANFNGKVSRFNSFGNLTSNLQELDLTIDRNRPNIYKGYRGGFASMWQAVDF